MRKKSCSGLSSTLAGGVGLAWGAEGVAVGAEGVAVLGGGVAVLGGGVASLGGGGAFDCSEQPRRARAIDRDAVRTNEREGDLRFMCTVSLAFPAPGAP